MFKVVLRFSDGATEVDDEVFDTEAEAEAYGSELCSNYSAGGEVMHLSNPGDYPLDTAGVDYEVVEVDAD